MAESAAVPATWGVAMLVPLIWTYRSSMVGARLARALLKSCRADRIFSPGATTSGFRLPSAVGPRDEK